MSHFYDSFAESSSFIHVALNTVRFYVQHSAYFIMSYATKFGHGPAELGPTVKNVYPDRPGHQPLVGAKTFGLVSGVLGFLQCP